MSPWSHISENPFFALVRNSFFYGIGDLLQKFLAILLLPVYTRYLDPADYGILAVVFTPTRITKVMTALIMNRPVSREVVYISRPSPGIPPSRDF